MTFTRATKKQQKCRMAITGPAKAGKTRTALSIAKHLGARVAVIDTERGSASKYAGEAFAPAEFDVAELRTFSPAEYRKAMREAAGYDVLVIDSLSHAWMGAGGLLDQKDKSTSKSSFDAWRTLTPQHNELVDALLGFPGHLIVTMRVKTEYVIETINGKQVPRKVGLAPVQRDGIEYEFDVLAEVDHDHSLHIPSSRCDALDGMTIRKPTGEEIASTLLAWLDDGAPTPTIEARLKSLRTKAALHEFLTEARARIREETDRAVSEPWVREAAERLGGDVAKAVAFVWPA